jgi:hypothetical protein
MAREFYNRQKSPQTIQRELELKGISPVPHVNTIKGWVQDLRRDMTPAWSIAAKDDEGDVDPQRVLPVLGYLLDAATGIKRLTTWEARVITRVRVARPDLGLETVWQLTRQLIAAQESGDLDRLDAVHAFLAKTKPGALAATLEPGGLFSGTSARTAAGTAVAWTVEGEQ